jgi:ribonuclease D
VLEQHSEAIAALTVRALAAGTENVALLSGVAPTPSEKFAADALFAAAQAIALSQSIDPAVVLARQDIADLHRRLISDRPVDDLRLMQGWRREAVGDKLLAVYRGEEPATLWIGKA